MKHLVMAALVFILTTLSADMVRNLPFSFTQPDGTELSLYLSGDEYYHRVHDENGYTILKHSRTGYAVYAVPEGNSIMESDHRVGVSSPAALGLMPNLFKQDSSISRRRDEQQRAIRDAGSRGLSTSTFNCIVAFLKFDDQSDFPLEPPFSDYNTNMNSSAEASLKDYFEEESNNRMHVNSYLYPGESAYGGPLCYENSYNRSHYLPWSGDNLFGYTEADKTTRMWGLISSLVMDLDEDVTQDVDYDDDGEVDALVVVIRGARDAWGELLWPARWHLDTSCGQINGADVHNFIITLEEEWSIGTVCHEMHHNIGFPDLYHYPSQSSMPDIEPCGSWDIMDTHSNIPQHSLVYTKYRYGQWCPEPIQLTPTATPTVYTLAAVSADNPYPCYRIASTNPNQHYILEHRKKTGRYEWVIPSCGLIVYRVNTTQSGNDDGPPDEVYVYRPGGVVNTNGYPNRAAFSADSLRTSFHNYTDPKPWLWVNSSTTPDGNLVLMNIGPAGGNSIQFTLQNFIPYVWDGSDDIDWNNPANWIQNSVPGELDYVEIPAGCPNYPNLTTNQTCYHLTVKTGGYLYLNTGTFTVTTDFENNGYVAMNNSSGRLEVQRDLKFNFGSEANVTAAATIAVQRNLEFHEGCSVDMDTGYIELFGTQHGYIRTYSPYVAINHLRSAKTGGFASGIGEISTEDLAIRGNIYVLDGSKFNHYYAGNTRLLGSFYAYAGSTLVMTQGTLSMEGSVSKNISITDAANYLNNLSVNKSTGVQVNLSTNIDVRGNLTIGSGTLNSNSHTISLRGAWNNTQGIANFTEGTGTVTLTGYLDQQISTETFFNLVLNKPGGAMTVGTGSSVSCASYDWVQGNLSVAGGTFTVTDLTDEGIFGTVTLTDGQINFQQDSSQYCDLRGTLNISGGTFRILGTMGTNYLSYIDVGTLNMSGGVLDYVHQGIGIPVEYIFNENITGGTIRTSRNFYIYRTDFTPAGGTIELYGSTDAQLLMSENPGSNLNNVTINKSTARLDSSQDQSAWMPDRLGESVPPNRTNTVTGVGLLNIDGTFRIEAGTFVAPLLMKIAGNWENLAGPDFFTQGTAAQTVVFDGAGTQYCSYTEVFNILQLNKSNGALRINQADADVFCAVYNWASGSIQVWDGSFTASDLGQNGVYGNYEAGENGIINLHQDSAQSIDVNGFLNIDNGAINLFGGSGNSFLGNNGPGGFVMNGGVLDFKDRGVTIQSVVDEFTFDLTGGAVIRLAGSWIDTRGNVVLDDCEVEMYSSTNNTVSSAATSRFYDLTINKAAANYVGATTGLRIDGTLKVTNCSFLSGTGNITTVGNGVEVYGILSIGSGSQLKLAAGTSLTVYDGGAIESVGSSTAYAYITRDVSGYYNLDIRPGGMIGARYTYFEYMGMSGLNINSGALVSSSYPLNYCTFRNGIAGGTLLTINNAQTLTLANISFPTNAGGGACNVTKTCNQGTVVLNPFGGAFSGTAYENDPDSRIFWGTAIQKVPTPAISYDDNQNQIWLDWVYPIPYTSFKIYRSASPGGPWASVGTSTTTFWHETASGPGYFYRVSAVGP